MPAKSTKPPLATMRLTRAELKVLLMALDQLRTTTQDPDVLSTTRALQTRLVLPYDRLVKDEVFPQ